MPLQIIRQDITCMQVDAIVNPTNQEMVGYSGVDLAIHTAAGEELDAECLRLSPLASGQAKITSGYRLPCKYIIHTAGPVWQGGGMGERETLRACYLHSLELAKAYECQTVAFPLISSGAYGYPKDYALREAEAVISDFLAEHEMTVFLCVYDADSYAFSRLLFEEIQSFIDEHSVHAHRSFRALSCDPPPRQREVRMEEELESLQRGFAECEIIAKPENMSERATPMACPPLSPNATLDDFLKDMEDGFAATLFHFIDARGMSDVECYKRANVDKKTFSKIKCNTIKTPKKRTAVAFAIALQLSFEETQKLLAAGGMALSHSSKFDMIVEYFIRKKNYNIFEINEALFAFDQELLGSL